VHLIFFLDLVPFKVFIWILDHQLLLHYLFTTTYNYLWFQEFSDLNCSFTQNNRFTASLQNATSFLAFSILFISTANIAITCSFILRKLAT